MIHNFTLRKDLVAVSKYGVRSAPLLGAGRQKSTGIGIGNKRDRRVPMSASQRAGLRFSVPRIAHVMRALGTTPGTGAVRLGETAPVYLAAIAEHLISEILEIAGNYAKKTKKKRVTARHLLWAVRNDEEINHLFEGVLMRGGYAYNAPLLR